VIALDASAILAIATDEPEGTAFAKLIAENDCIFGAPSKLEAAMVLNRRTTPQHTMQLTDILKLKNVVVVAFSDEHAMIAEVAFMRFGRGSGHPARLNFGDCMAYAVARVASVPLLFKGDDFAHTDIVPAWTP
jgi:ribonuclease VapC